MRFCTACAMIVRVCNTADRYISILDTNWRRFSIRRVSNGWL